jgi:plasmid stabilization system protein ParE
MKIVISKLASEEIENSNEYYNQQQINLGNIFKDSVQEIIDSIRTNPYLYPNITPEIKRTILYKFPFYIYYFVAEKEIVILSVAHQHRKPLY